MLSGARTLQKLSSPALRTTVRKNCGIAGMINAHNPEVLKKMLDVTKHRGLESQQFEFYNLGDSKAGIGINRLRIVDLEGGDQPLHTDDNTVHSVGNGMIYNHNEVREELEARGHKYRTRNDMQALPQLFKEYGEEMTQYMDGMYAFCVVDEKAGKFICGRDPLGKKPFFYIRDPKKPESFYFCSEAKGLLETGLDLANIEVLPPGCILTEKGVEKKRFIPRRYSSPNPILVYSLLEQAVRKRLIADVPIATFLSGGIDSSIVTALAAKHHPDLTAITVGVPGSPDVEHAKLVAKYLGIRHEIVEFSIDDIERQLEHSIWHTESYCPPTVTNGVTTYIASKAATDLGFKVVLVGEGADEVFGGYKCLRHMNAPELYEATHTMINNIYMTECQRVDRMAMAATLEARVPFLDPTVVEYGVNLPHSAKLKNDGKRLVEKILLRQAFDGVIPDEILWREKEPFDQGSGARNVLDRINASITDEEVVQAQKEFPHANIESREMLYYYRIWRKFFGNMGGSKQFDMFGNYPIMHDQIKVRTPSSSS